MSKPSDRESVARGPGPDALWDDWCRARKLEPRLTPRDYLARSGPVVQSVLDELELLLALEFQSPPSPLVDAITLDLGAGEVRFAGFRLLETLGQGSSGIVYLARDERAGGKPVGANSARTADAVQPLVAFKVLNPLLSASPERRDSILHEAEVAGSLDHEGIVRVLASGVERGYAWIATEYVEGETLDRLIGREDRPPLREALALDVGQQLARALEHAHARGVVHRDLKPSNLILSDGGRVKVLDFGLARTQGTAFSMSRTGEMIGTPLYMAPEQARGVGEIGPWTDVYAVGLVLWEIASGRKLDEDEPLHALLARIARGRYRIRSRDLRGIKLELASVIRRCLEPHPADRYQSCAKLLADLDDVRAGREPRMGAMSMLRRWSRARARNRAQTASWFLGIALFCTGTYWLWWNWPVAVELRTVNDGKQIWIDGVEQETGSVRITLRPGHHEWRAQFADLPEVFTGSFEVLPHTPRHLLLFLSPWRGMNDLDLGTPRDAGKFAWVVIATPTEEVDFSIDGVDHGVIPGLSQFALPFGKHKLEARSQGLKTWTREIDLTTQDMCFLPFEMEAEGSEWETVLLYSHFDDFVRGNTAGMQDLRPYAEKEALDEFSRFFVWKTYLGPGRADQAGSILVRVPVDGVVEDLQVEFAVSPFNTKATARTQVSMGPAKDRLDTVLDLGPGADTALPPPFRTVSEGLRYWTPPDSALDRVRADVRGSRELYVRWSVGGVVPGSDQPYAFALRTNALPDRRSDGELLWSPALKIRVKTHH